MSKALPKGGSALRYAQGYERPALLPGRSKSKVGAGAMGDLASKSYKSSMTGNAGLNYAAWQLSRRGWHAMPTIRNARGSDLFITDSDGTVFFGVQSKALSKRNAVALGRDIGALQSEWWVITVQANSDAPTCFILKIEEVRRLAVQDKNGGAYWLDPRGYDQAEFKEAWDRIGQEAATPKAEQDVREARNGVRRPAPGGKCAAVWDYLDINPQTTVHEMRLTAKSLGWNVNNAATEFYQWRKFNGTPGPDGASS